MLIYNFLFYSIVNCLLLSFYFESLRNKYAFPYIAAGLSCHRYTAQHIQRPLLGNEGGQAQKETIICHTRKESIFCFKHPYVVKKQR